MIFVIIGHSGIPCGLNKFIFSFHMPLFFIIAGYFAKSNEETNLSFSRSILKDSKRLLLPYVITSIGIILFTLLRAIFKQDYSIVVEKTKDMLYVSSDAGPIWFFVALFWVRIIYRYIMNFRQWALPLSILISGTSIWIVHHCMQLPFCFLTALAAMVFYAVGWYYYKFGFPKWLLIISMICWPLLLCSPRIDLYHINYGIYPLTILGASGASYILYNLSLYIYKIERACGVLQWIGKNSIVILCLHTFDIHCCYVTMILSGLLSIHLPYWPTQILRDVLVLLASWLFVTYVKFNEIK